MKKEKIEKKLQIVESHELTEEEKVKVLVKLRKKCNRKIKSLERKAAILDWFTEDTIGEEGAKRFAGIFLPLSFLPMIISAILSSNGLPDWLPAVGGIATVLQLFATIIVGYTAPDGKNILDRLDDKVYALYGEIEKLLQKVDDKLEELGYKVEKRKLEKISQAKTLEKGEITAWKKI